MAGALIFMAGTRFLPWKSSTAVDVNSNGLPVARRGDGDGILMKGPKKSQENNHGCPEVFVGDGIDVPKIGDFVSITKPNICWN